MFESGTITVAVDSELRAFNEDRIGSLDSLV